MVEYSNQNNNENYKERLTNFSNEFDIGLFLHIVRKAVVWVVACVILSIGAAVLYLRYTPEIYQAKVILQVGQDDNANKVLNVGQYLEDNALQTKVELIRSKLLIDRSLSRMPMEIGYFAKGEILTNEHYTLSPFSVQVTQIRNEGIQNRPIVVHFDNEQRFSLTYRGQVFEDLPVNQPVDIEDAVIKLNVRNWKSLSQSLEEEYQLYFVINSPKALVNRFSRKLEVRILNNIANTIEIAYKDNNPRIARDFVVAHANEFIAFDLERRIQSDDNILNFIDDQIDVVFGRLTDSESLLNSYKQDNKITNLESISGVYLNRLTEFEDELIRLELEEGLLSEVGVLTTKSSTDIEIYNLVPLIAGSKFEGSLSNLLHELHTLLIRKEEVLYHVTKDNEQIKSLEFQIGIQKNVILKSIEALLAKIGDRKETLARMLSDVESVYFGLPEKELEFARLRRLFNINEKYYTMLLEKRIEYRISKEGFVTNHEILEEADIPKVPISPKRNMVAISFVMAGLLFGFLIISVKYLLHNDLTSLNEIIKHSQASMATLGIIPTYKDEIPDSMLLVGKSPKSLIAEAFRTIRTNMQFIENEPGPKTAAVTSTISGEGKTFIALNLAGIIAFSGKKVVVIDLDMRKPKIHKGFGVDNDEGMSTLLSGRTSIDKCLKQSDVENLDYITAGPIPPNPSELIINPRMDSIIEELKSRYDMVIIDTPPVGIVTDGVDVIRKVNYPLYIFRADYSKRQFVQIADRLMNEHGIKNLSVILNGVDLDRKRYSYNYGYGYGYGYSYKHGYYDDASSRKRGFWNRLMRR